MATKSNKLILVAEDDKFYSGIYKKKLEEEGYNIQIVGNGKEAVNLAKTKIPDLVLLDLIMPIQDGFDTLEIMRKDEKLKNVPIVILSNLGQEEDKKKTKELGANEYVVKSDLSIGDVIKLIQKYID